MTNPIEPCIPFVPGQLPDSTLIINGGSVVIPEDDNDDIIITRFPTRPRFPDREEVPPGGGGGGGGGEDDGGGGSPETPRWTCRSFTVAGFGGLVTRKICVSGFDVSYPFTTKAECEAECASVGQIDPEEVDPNLPQDYQYEEYPRTELGDLLISESYFPIATNDFTFDPKPKIVSGTTIFESNIDSSIYNLISGDDDSVSGINENLSKLSDSMIRQSLRQEIKNILYKLYGPDGRTISEARINKSLKVKTINKQITKVNQRYIFNLAVRAAVTKINANAETTRRIVTATYGKTVQEIVNSRLGNLLRLSPTQSIQPITPDINRALDRIELEKIPLTPSSYTDINSELMKLWYILPEDIYAKTTVVDSSGVTTRLKIPNSELLPVVTSSNQVTGVLVNEYTYNASVVTQSGTVSIPTNTQIHRAYTINNNVEEACLFDTGSKFSIVFTVSSVPSANLELTYDVSAPRPNHYMLLLDKTTIQDLPFNASPFVKKTSAQYTIETSESAFQDAIRFRPYPWLVLPIDHNDPIFGHFATGSKYTVDFTNFNLEEFGDDLNGPIIVRKVPKSIIILPTDRYDYLFYGGYSTLSDWNVRQLNFSLSPDPNYYNPNIKDHYYANISLAYPNTDITDEYSETAMRASFSSSITNINDTFIDGQEPTRSVHGFRSAVNIASSLNFNYYTNEGILWTDIYKRLTKEQYTTLKIGIPNYMLDRLRAGEKTGIKLFHDKAGDLSTATRLVGLKPNKVDDLPIYLNI